MRISGVAGRYSQLKTGALRAKYHNTCATYLGYLMYFRICKFSINIHVVIEIFACFDADSQLNIAQGVKRFLRDYCQNTGLHGFRYIVTGETTCHKMVWLMVRGTFVHVSCRVG